MFNRSIPPITKNLLIINALFFLAKYVAQQSWGIDLDTILGAFYPESVNFKSWQIITHMFMHGNLSHFFFNMFALWMFGSVVENTLGEKKFLILYFAAGLGAFVLHNAVSYFELMPAIEQMQLANVPIEELKEQFLVGNGVTRNAAMEKAVDFANQNKYQITQDTFNKFMGSQIGLIVGASGAIYGLLVAFGVLYPNQKLMLIFLPVPIKAKYFIPILIVMELFMGIQDFSWNPIAHFAHLGGAIIGFLLVRYWKKNQYRLN